MTSLINSKGDSEDLNRNTVAQSSVATTTTTTSDHQPPTTTSTQETMVAGHAFFSSTGTPPMSPLRHGMKTTTTTTKPSPLQGSERSPTRKSMSVVSPTPSSNGYPTSNETSPLPPSSRAQPANAAAPKVGNHHKTGSLVGFDPLLDMGDLSSPKGEEPATPTGSNHKETFAANLTLSPLSPPANGKARANTAELEGELRKLAMEVIAQSPQRNEESNNQKGKIRKPKFGRATSLTPKFNLTPPLQFSKNNNNNVQKEPSSAPHRKMPWQRHRRSQSLEVPTGAVGSVNNLIEQQENQKIPLGGGSNLESPMANHTNSMMADLYDVVTSTQDALAIPSLARPAPTSFLTGKEVVRSSEFDPSPFQMELPSLDQVIVNARLTQFVELYRKDDMNFDLNMSLVGRRRMELQNFLALDKVPVNSNLSSAHKPLVESFLETAEDVTLVAFIESTNAQSADTRREVVIFERQMEFIVVFRGTTPEQQGKTPLFKKNKAVPLDTLDEDADCKVYTGMKESYLDLERRVFAALDNLMDQNPFCGVVFSGSSWGGTMATLGAYRYALNRPVVRVGCQTFGSPKVGNRVFRQHANSLPNLKVMRVEYASDSKCFVPSDGSHVGHSIVLGKEGQNNAVTALAYKFDDDHDDRKAHHSHKPIFAAWKKERDITSYVGSLEEMKQKKLKWVTDFAGENGTGVRGKDNEQRQVV